VILAAALPTRPPPAAGPLLAQAATALADLERAERESCRQSDLPRLIQQHPIWESAGRNLAAVSARLVSPAERIQRAVEPWSAYFILPLFAFSATGVDVAIDLESPEDARVMFAVITGLVLGKPIGILLASWLAIRARAGTAPANTTLRAFVGAACLCGVGVTVALLMADEAFPSGNLSSAAKIGVLTGSALAAVVGIVLIMSSKRLGLPATSAELVARGRTVRPRLPRALDAVEH
jgi:NhaA family Na+:H+ antiporter